MTPCGAKTTKVECHLEAGHSGLHLGLLDLPMGRYADIMWADEWSVESDLPWAKELPMIEDGPVMPVCVYSGDSDFTDLAWFNN
jgi:hypothetical protein